MSLSSGHPGTTTAKTASGTRSALAEALGDLVHEIPYLIEHLPGVASELFWTVLIPLLGVLLVLAVLATATSRIRRILYPPTPHELHRDALLLLQQQQQQQRKRKKTIVAAVKAATSTTSHSNSNTKSDLKPVLDMLETASRRGHVPATLSLAACHLYQLGDGRAALAVLRQQQQKQRNNNDSNDDDKNNNSNDDDEDSHFDRDIKSLQFDAEALLAGHGHMIQRELRLDEYLGVAFALHHHQRQRRREHDDNTTTTTTTMDGLNQRTHHTKKDQ
jgi:hypothetical protein